MMIAIKLKLPRFIKFEKLWGLRMKMLTIFILSGLIPLTVTGVIAYFATVNTMEKQAALAGRRGLKAIAGNVEQLAGNIEMISSQIASDPELKNLVMSFDSFPPETAERESLNAKINARFRPWIASNQQIQRITILGNPSLAISDMGNAPAEASDPVKVSGTFWYQQAVNLGGRPLWVVTPSELGGEPDNDLSCIRFVGGTLPGPNFLLVVKLNPRAVRRIVSRTLFAGGGKVYLVDPERTLFKAKSPAADKKAKPDQLHQDLYQLVSNTRFQKQAGLNRPLCFKHISRNNATVFYQPLHLPGWFLLGTISEPEWTSPFLATKLGYIIIIILLGGLALWGCLVFSKYWAEPLPQISEAFKQLASGAPAQSLEVRRDDEIGHLARTYTRVYEKFKRIIAEVDLTTRQLSSISGQIIERSEEVTHCSTSIFGTLDELTEATANEAAEVISCISNISLLTESIHTVNDYAALIQQIKTEILQLTTQGKATLENLEYRSHETKTITIDINRLIYNLNEQTQEIQDIVSRIREIVVQTDMISLNATIEATRIKDIKKEVLALAHDVKKHVDYSASATRKITEVILRIESKTSQATAMAEVANEAVASQSDIIQQCTQVFNDIRTATDLLVQKFETVIGLMDMVENNKNEIMGLTGVISGATEEIVTMTETLNASFQKERTIMENLAADTKELEKCTAGLRENIREHNLG
jgi:methyl-accepting chemotaxis protein